MANKFYELRLGAAIAANGSAAAAVFTGAEVANAGAGLGLKPPPKGSRGAAGLKAGAGKDCV